MDLENNQTPSGESARECVSAHDGKTQQETRAAWITAWSHAEESDERPMAIRRGGEGRAGGIPLN